MRSKSCEAGSAPGGFTLLELIVVLAIAGLLAGVVVFGLGAGSQGREHRSAITHLASELQLARVSAMQQGGALRVSIRLTPDALECEYASITRRFPCRELGIATIDSKAPPEEWSGVLFRADGRTDSRRIAFAREGGSDTLLPYIEFDPISGAIELGRATDAPPRDQGGADR